jgi:hypothetical protein
MGWLVRRLRIGAVAPWRVSAGERGTARAVPAGASVLGIAFVGCGIAIHFCPCASLRIRLRWHG